MKFSILVNEGPFNHQAGDTAYQFARAALARGHEVMRVFFYYDGVHNAHRNSAPQADERNIVARWSKLAEEHGVDLAVCVAAGLRRGVTEAVTAPGFRITGLGQLIEASIDAERTMVFGD